MKDNMKSDNLGVCKLLRYKELSLWIVICNNYYYRKLLSFIFNKSSLTQMVESLNPVVFKFVEVCLFIGLGLRDF